MQLGAPAESLWTERRARIEQAMAVGGDEIARLGAVLLDTLGRYAAEADQAGASFVETQITMLFATVGQKSE
ncbi:hypothetical protein D3C83_127410 [compost metagenome]